MRFLATLTITLLGVPSTFSHFRCDVPDEWLTASINSTTDNFFPGAKWPNGIVKYELHSSLTSADRQEVQKAFDEYHAKTCIRFQSRSPGEAAYVSIENDPNTCGVAVLCRTGGAQYAKFGGSCRRWTTMVHELGHSLCLGHEQTRSDRDDYLEYRNCNPSQIPGKNDYDLRGSLFDYGSCMHYGPCGSCSIGWAKQGDDVPCGHDGLSVMDVDKLNEFYNCGGCYGHRWRPIDALTDADRRAMMKLGESIDGKPLYACRAMFRGEVSVGKYFPEHGVCYISYERREYIFRNKAQVFTTPTQILEEPAQSNYRMIHVNATEAMKQQNPFPNAVPAGRTREGVRGFIAMATVTDAGMTERSVGKVYENNWGKAYFPFNGKEIEVYSGYAVVTCG